MVVKNIVVGPLEANCIVIADENTKEALVIDPGDEPEKILNLIGENNFKTKFIVCTHAHFDHIGAVPEIKKETNAQIIIHKDEIVIYQQAKELASFWGYELDSLPEPDILVEDGQNLNIGNLKFKVLHTPGHSPGGICIYGEGILVSGDTLFAGSVGRTDLFGGDTEKLKKSFKKLMTLPDNVKVHPGHGPSSTIKQEKINNILSDEKVDI
ncbi:MAG: MBL fold metallo-hydrolase [Nitrospirae bacterium]|nr:MBL fold metallo-hydrolase [Nitrospirota bacterium]